MSDSSKQKRISDDDQVRFQERQNQIYPDIGRELIALTPEDWNSALLELTRTEDGIAHSISSEEKHRDIVMPSMELFEHTRRLELLFEEFKCMWLIARFRIRKSKDEEWKFSVDYEYPAEPDGQRTTRGM